MTTLNDHDDNNHHHDYTNETTTDVSLLWYMIHSDASYEHPDHYMNGIVFKQPPQQRHGNHNNNNNMMMVDSNNIATSSSFRLGPGRRHHGTVGRRR